MKSSTKAVCRFAPSPTGSLHIGAMRTALFNYLYARGQAGRFILRLDDTDRVRSEKKYEEEIKEALAWLGLEYDLFIRQSDRVELYDQKIRQLLDQGLAYTVTEPAKAGQGQIELIRFKNPNRLVNFVDRVRGPISFQTDELGDFVIAKAGQALYHLASVIDDLEEGISHIIRGEDHISNTPRQILLIEALGGHQPVWVHMPLTVGPDRAKLSKRHGAQPILTYRDQGFLPTAVINFMALLGWSPQAGPKATNQEVFDLNQLIDRFDLDGIGAGSATFNPDKLIWLNREHLRRLTPTDQARQILNFLPPDKAVNWPIERLTRLAPIIFERATTGRQAAEQLTEGEFSYLLDRPIIRPEQLETTEYLPAVIEILTSIPEADWQPEKIKQALKELGDQHGRRPVLAPIRQILTGRDKSPDPFTIGWLLGKTETIARLAEINLNQ